MLRLYLAACERLRPSRFFEGKLMHFSHRIEDDLLVAAFFIELSFAILVVDGSCS